MNLPYSFIQVGVNSDFILDICVCVNMASVLLVSGGRTQMSHQSALLWGKQCNVCIFALKGKLV